MLAQIRWGALVSLLTLSVVPLWVAAKEAVQVQLSATVSAELDQNEVRLVFAAQASAQTAAAVNAALNRDIAQALQALGQPATVRISTGSFQVYPVYDRKDRGENQVSGWRGEAELVLSSSDWQATSLLAEKLTGRLALSAMSFSLSDQVRRAEQARLLTEAARAFQEKAQATAKAFGFQNYRLGKLQISESGEPAPTRLTTLARASAGAAENSPVNLRPAKRTVSVTVSGSVDLY